MNTIGENTLQIFNSPIEIGLRILYVLNELNHKGCDLQRLVYYDYMLIHSGDILNGPKSIHPNTPFRTTEILVKREILQKGLILMQSKELVESVFDSTGILYKATEITKDFLEYNTTEYANNLKAVAKWLISKFDNYSDDKLSLYIKNNLNIWGGEFSKEALFHIEEDK